MAVDSSALCCSVMVVLFVWTSLSSTLDSFSSIFFLGISGIFVVMVRFSVTSVPVPSSEEMLAMILVLSSLIRPAVVEFSSKSFFA